MGITFYDGNGESRLIHLTLNAGLEILNYEFLQGRQDQEGVSGKAYEILDEIWEAEGHYPPRIYRDIHQFWSMSDPFLTHF